MHGITNGASTADRTLPEGLAHALISSELETWEINRILATGVTPSDIKENP